MIDDMKVGTTTVSMIEIDLDEGLGSFLCARLVGDVACEFGPTMNI